MLYREENLQNMDGENGSFGMIFLTFYFVHTKLTELL